MLTLRIILCFMFVLVLGARDSGADMVILKTGEMFQTRKAWKENGYVMYYREGRVVRVSEQAVERVIHSAAPEGERPPAIDRRKEEAPATGSPSIAPPTPQSADQTGHLGLVWGQSPTTIDGLTLTDTDPAYGGVELYTRNQRVQRFGRAQVDAVFYGFCQGGLYTILFEVSNYLDFTDLKAEAFRRYGVGTPDGGVDEKYRWRDGAADRLLAYDDAAGTGYLWMRSREIHEKVRLRYPE